MFLIYTCNNLSKIDLDSSYKNNHFPSLCISLLLVWSFGDDKTIRTDLLIYTYVSMNL